MANGDALGLDVMDATLSEKRSKPRPAKWPRAALRDLLESVEYYGEPEGWPPGLYEQLQFAALSEPKPQ
ncbi:hypothetical protein JY651_28565 [Pyxidicoccus parkwayensis]|uniref:Uncharacterized protein n=1 Tax=Pyxidicoccus parkwayensis TaxID=2813578 RepID=A0ABX7NKD6_9BACT|nr:hypothetical protein [Pyxidicoccus parkwaysis]QSQ19286.1 hypothetical protein JY651_28565 [Pyxidicoccus parkwaysis]